MLKYYVGFLWARKGETLVVVVFFFSSVIHNNGFYGMTIVHMYSSYSYRLEVVLGNWITGMVNSLITGRISFMCLLNSLSLQHTLCTRIVYYRLWENNSNSTTEGRWLLFMWGTVGHHHHQVYSVTIITLSLPMQYPAVNCAGKVICILHI